MQLMESPQYLKLLQLFCADFPDWDKLCGKCLLMSGATGMIGSFLIDAIMLHNETMENDASCKIIALGRSREKAEQRFLRWMGQPAFQFYQHNICLPITLENETPDFIIHAASNTHPLAYSTEPINTILSNILGTQHLLELAVQNANSRFLLVSSVEIYGSNRGDTEYFTEDYCGYIDCNTLRAGYPEGKRVSEALCQAYQQEKNVEFVTVRLPRCYGPTMQWSDSKAIAQFIKKSVMGEDIVLKSDGKQLYSYASVFDAAMAFLWVLLRGAPGNAYNVGDEKSNITLGALAQITADFCGKKVVFELPEEQEKLGYSKTQKALMNAEKLRALGWQPRYEIQTGIMETVSILREVLSDSSHNICVQPTRIM